MQLAQTACAVCSKQHLSHVMHLQAIGTEAIPKDVATVVRNNGGGHFNHTVRHGDGVEEVSFALFFLQGQVSGGVPGLVST